MLLLYHLIGECILRLFTPSHKMGGGGQFQSSIFSKEKHAPVSTKKKRGGKRQTRFQFQRTVRGGKIGTVRGGKIADAKKLKMKKRVSFSVSTHG